MWYFWLSEIKCIELVKNPTWLPKWIKWVGEINKNTWLRSFRKLHSLMPFDLIEDLLPCNCIMVNVIIKISSKKFLGWRIELISYVERKIEQEIGVGVWSVSTVSSKLISMVQQSDSGLAVTVSILLKPGNNLECRWSLL